jgi:hypothetical protein
MRTNPNIILSGNQMAAPQLPDVNAMMQTRTAGMENIYKIEQARAEQARAAQKEQEAAAAEAMLPSVLAAYSDASDVGLDRATSLMPAEVRDTFAPFITRLKGIPDTATRKSILEAELAKDEAGRAVLGRILTPYQEGTLGIQREQQEIARQRLAQDAAAANQPKVSFRETDAEGNVRMYDAAGNEIGMLPKAGKPAAAAGGTAATESERLAGYNAGRALDAAKRIAAATKQSPEATAPGEVEAFTSLFVDPNFVRGEERQRVSSAQREMIDALLTLATGAAYNREQLEGQMESYVPRYTDRPGTREDKRTALLGLIQNAKIKAGRAWTPEMDASFEQLLTPLGGKTDLQPPPAGTATGRIPQISSDEEYDRLPSGAVYIDPNGQQRTKR